MLCLESAVYKHEFYQFCLRSFGNAHQDDLFAALEEQARNDGTGTWLSDNSLSDLMENWTF